MSDNVKLNLDQLRQENLKGAFESFERAIQILEIDFYLIGAFARDTWLAEKGIRALGTKDIDLAVFISDDSKYDELKRYLVEEEGFIISSTNEYTFIDKVGYQVDILPFGAIEIEGKKFTNSSGLVSTSVSGFAEVYKEATEEVVFENKHVFKVSSLAGIVILKLLAWDDRPEMRTKDIQDIAIILNNYFTLESEMIYEKYNDLFEKEPNLELLSARALGREIQLVLNHNLTLKERIISILDKNTQSLENSEIGRLLVNHLNLSPPMIEIAVDYLIAISNGINDEV